MVMIAAIQMRSARTPAENLGPLQDMVRAAARDGARYVQTPEMTGAIERDRAAMRAQLTTPENDIIVQTAAALAAELGITLHIGSTAVLAGNGQIANRGFVFGPDGGQLATYDKLHMFDVDLPNGESWRESASYSPGENAVLVEAEGLRIGLGICYDLRFPELFAQYGLAGADMLTVPAAFTRQTGEAHWHVLLRARAIETGSFVVAAAQGGRHDDGRETFGHSLVVDPWGKVIAEKDDDEPGVILADIDPEAVRAARGRIPNLQHRRAIAVRGAGA